MDVKVSDGRFRKMEKIKNNRDNWTPPKFSNKNYRDYVASKFEDKMGFEYRPGGVHSVNIKLKW